MALPACEAVRGSVQRRPALCIFDLDGVIYRGDSVLPSAADALSALRNGGTAVSFLTNNSTQTRESYARKLNRMGIPATPEEVMTSAHATALYFREAYPEGATAYVIGEEGLLSELSWAGVHTAWVPPDDPVDAVVVGLDRGFTYEKLWRAQQAILAGARFIATNSDTTYPVEGDRLIPGGGSLVAAVKAATSVEPVLIGKPATFALHKVLEMTGAAAEDTMLVGDRLDTDVLAGRRMGFRTVLVLTGVSGMADVEAAPEEMRPDCVIPDLSHLPGLA